MFYYLLTHPECYQRLRAEVDEAFPPSDVEPFDGTKLAEMKYLNAVMLVLHSFNVFSPG